MKEIKIRWSEFPKHQKIEVFIKDPMMGEIKQHGYNKYVYFNAYVEIADTHRQFMLVLPKHKVDKAFSPLQVSIKQSPLIKLILSKEDKGIINIHEITNVHATTGTEN